MTDHQERVDRFALALVTGLAQSFISPEAIFDKAESLANESERRYGEILGEYDPDVAMPVFDTVRK